ncbi:MAG TPA: hypothetical protein VFP84_14495 [Kofleriaceae bacterium]|nr:hypothetical protein [Kofleriaceae bacterium]
MKPAIGLVVVLAPALAAAQPAPGPALDDLERALPPGWTMLATGSELVFRHDRPCYVTTAAHAGKPAPAGGGPLVTFELRFRLEPRWTAAQITAAHQANDKVERELRALVGKYHVDQIHHVKGKPQPANPDEQARLAAYDSEHARIAKRLVPVPRCALGDASLFAGEDTYAQLQLALDPPEVIPEAHRILALIEQRCR